MSSTVHHCLLGGTRVSQTDTVDASAWEEWKLSFIERAQADPDAAWDEFYQLDPKVATYLLDDPRIAALSQERSAALRAEMSPEELAAVDAQVKGFVTEILGED